MKRGKGLPPGRRSITWSNPTNVGTTAAAPQMRPYIPDPERLTAEELQAWEPFMKPGCLFALTRNVALQQFGDKVIKPPFPYLAGAMDWSPPETILARSGSIAMYAGEIRVEEQDSKGHTLRPIRHTFIVAGGRYIVPSLGWMRPV
jgi:hypothetical protein